VEVKGKFEGWMLDATSVGMFVPGIVFKAHRETIPAIPELLSMKKMIGKN
jgi:hypothetical protein